MNINSIKCPLFCAAVSIGISMNAAEPVDWGEMQPDVEYRYEMFVPVSGYYTPKESGVLKGYSTGEEISVYKDAAHQEEIISELSFYTSSGEKGLVYPVTKGETVYFYNAYLKLVLH